MQKKKKNFYNKISAGQQRCRVNWIVKLTIVVSNAFQVLHFVDGPLGSVPHPAHMDGSMYSYVYTAKKS